MKIQNSPRKRVAMPFLLFSWLVLCFAPYIVHSADTLGEAAAPNANEATKLARMQALELRVQREGTVPVIVQLDLSTQGTARYRPEQQLPNRGAIDQQRSAIAQAQVQVLAQVSIPPWRSIKRFDRLPYLAVQVDATNLAQLAQSSQVEAIYEDRLNKLTLDDSVPLIEADSAWSAGYSGAGVAVAILDSGVDKLHSFLSGKVVEEACFSTNNPGNQASSLCPNNTEVQIGSGAGVNCTGIGGCNHGTHVAGIAAGRGTSFHGVARDADIVAIQVFSRIDDAGFCGSSTPCLAAYDSDIVQALAHISNLSTSLNIASVNISLGGRVYTSEAACDADNALTKAAIDQLSNQNIATVIAAGNNANSSGLTSPACISSAISIGASTKLDAVASYSNSAAFLDLLAPGSSITSSIPGGSFGGSSGTSMATPHVAGAWAVVKQFMGSNASVNAVLSSLVGTGTPINDARNGQTKPRIDVAKAIGLSADPLLITTLALADGVKDLSYAEQLSASGGVAPYTWSVLSGALPNGIVLNASTGQLSGTPTSSGSSAFTVQVVDNAGTQEAQPLSITVAASAP